MSPLKFSQVKFFMTTDELVGRPLMVPFSN